MARHALIRDEPPLLGRPRHDALLGAIGEHLARRWHLGAPPAWTEQPERFLTRPWFLGSERMKPFDLAESPLAFRRRLIFTESEPLRRATMPKDARFWAYEALRTGIGPE